ncbi:hypothetical protein C7293_27010 [filamentous cyanobacterium CCT1]|nr:hypothetical protein C7293_27010 [filamentous cyanobacterium CCT1]PSN76484.1 hypothetical protein C8B47_27060 [filamentous cyanobacterium CCP4]
MGFSAKLLIAWEWPPVASSDSIGLQSWVCSTVAAAVGQERQGFASVFTHGMAFSRQFLCPWATARLRRAAAASTQQNLSAETNSQVFKA